MSDESTDIKWLVKVQTSTNGSVQVCGCNNEKQADDIIDSVTRNLAKMYKEINDLRAVKTKPFIEEVYKAKVIQIKKKGDIFI